MTEDKARAPSDRAQDSKNLLMRVLAGAVLAPVAIAVAYTGGWLWTGLATLAAIGMYVEWLLIVAPGPRTRPAAAGTAALLIAGICLMAGRLDGALVTIGLGVIVVPLLAERPRQWVLGGLGYAAAAQIASVLLRLDPKWGFTALFFVLLIVWTTDIGGYFAGRGIGGPKLWVRVSPKKTWAGAIGGLAGSLVVAAGFAMAGVGRTGPLLLVGAALSVVSQLGDLFESAVKRRFGVKDSSNIIPGHGGLLDRLDGFVAAIVVGALIGVIRGGIDGVGRGLMIW